MNNSGKQPFQKEYEWLKKNLPQALFKGPLPQPCYDKCPSIEKAISGYIKWLRHSKLNYEEEIYIEK